MKPSSDLVVLLFGIDIGIHLAVTVGVGLWLYKVTKKGIEAAADKMWDAVVARMPLPMRQMFGLDEDTSSHNERVSA